MIHAPFVAQLGTILKGDMYIVLPDIVQYDEAGHPWTLPVGYRVEIWNRTYYDGGTYDYKLTKVYVCVNQPYNTIGSETKKKTIIDAHRDLNYRINMNNTQISKQIFIWTGWYWVCERDDNQ